MTITNGYITLAEFKQRAGIASTDNARDADIELAIGGACRLIDSRCGRSFYSATASARYFTAQDYRRLYLDDFSAITSLETDDDGDGTIETTWTASDYVALPASSPSGTPYLWLEITPQGDYRFPKGLRNGCKITAAWGWAAVPDEVREAAYLQANRLYQRRSAPLGIVGNAEFGVTTIGKLDPDIEMLLAPFVRMTP